MQMNAKEMIPFLIKTYNAEKKDHDILTLLMLLMKEIIMNHLSLQPLIRNCMEKNPITRDYLNFNKANEDLIIKRATDFYNGIKN
jgi:hypothetical protein